MSSVFIKKMIQNRMHRGLTLVEVMVSMLVSGLFLSTALQAYVAATAMRTQGGSQKGAIAIAQNDIEFVRDKAQDPALNDPAYCASANGQGYGQKLMDTVQDQLGGNRIPGGVTPTVQGSQQTLTVDKPNPDGSPGYRLTRTMTLPDNSSTLSKDALLLAYVIYDIRPKNNGSGAVGGGNSGSNPQNNSGSQNDVVVGKFDTAVMPSAALGCP